MNQRVEFAHSLRGIAAISVVVAHYCGTFFQSHAGIAALLQVPPLASLPPVSGPVRLVGDYAIVFGQFGVGIFFIISGFVIPFSLSWDSRLDFLKRRMLRIYPVYIAGFALVMLSVWLLTRYAGSQFGYPPAHLLTHLGIILRGLTGHYRIDGISWTLEVELAFYLLMAIGGMRLISMGPKPFYAGAILVASAAALSHWLMRSGYHAQIGLIGLQFWAALLLVAGLAYHALHRAKLTPGAFAGIQSAIAALLIAVWRCANQGIFHWQWIAGYLLAMVVFAAAYSCRRHIKSNRLLDHLANISYPLYVVHALFGYAVMYWAISSGASAGTAILAAGFIVYIASLLLHFGVERPFLQKSRTDSRPDAAMAPRAPQGRPPIPTYAAPVDVNAS